MKIMRAGAAAMVAGIAAGLGAWGAAHAAAYPAKPIRIVTTSVPGSPTDVLARVAGGDLTKAWGQQIVVENRGGAGGQIAAQLVAEANADGYTLFSSSDGPMAIIPAIKRRVPYDPIKDFEPVAFGAYNNYMLVVNSNLPVHSVAELVKRAKSEPGKLRYGSAGVGSPNHLGMELFKLKAGMDLTHVPYKGGPAAMVDLLSGQIEVMMAGPVAIPLIKAGRLRALAVPSSERSPLTPDLPPIADTVPGVDVRTWEAFFAPAGTPPAIVKKLHDRITRHLAAPETARLLAAKGLAVQAMTRAQVHELVVSSLRRNRELVRALEIPLID